MTIHLRSLVLGFFTLIAFAVLAEGQSDLTTSNDSELPPGYLARVNLNQPAEILAILQRAEVYFNQNFNQSGPEKIQPPVVMVLHGPEIAMFARNNYRRNQVAIDLAAKLTAFNIIDVRVCETRMVDEGLTASDLLPFVSTVPYGPAEEIRLKEEERYVYF